MKFNTEKKGYSITAVDTYIKKTTEEHQRTIEAQRARIEMLKEQLEKAENALTSYKEKTSLITKAIFNAVSKAEEIEKLATQKYAFEIARLKAFHDKWNSYYHKIIQNYPLDDELIAAAEFNKNVRKILSGQADDNLSSSNAANSFEQNFESESTRLKERRIGYISVKTDETAKTKPYSEDVDAILNLIPNADLKSPILSDNPVERIRNYLARQKKKEKKISTPKSSKNIVEENSFPQIKDDFASTGFSFEEALNPKDDLETILKDLGLEF